MTLVNTKKMFSDALKKGYAIPAFNVCNLESAQAVAEVAGEKKVPVIIAVSEGAANYAGYDYIDTHRKEIFTVLSSKITRNWSVDMFNRQDLVNNRAISNGGGIIYEDECSRFAFHVEKEYSDDPSDENELAFYFSFYLKTLGGIGTD